MMNASQTSILDHLEFRPPTSHPRIAELLAGKAMPGPGDLTPVNSLPTFTAALPAASKAPKSTRPRTPELIPLPSPTTLREVVSSAMDELPVAMPAPVIKPVAEKPTIVQPLPLPQETPTEAKLPVFDPPTSKRQPIEPKPQAVEPKPKTVEPKPKAVEPKPKAIEPKPKAVEPKPQAIEPKPQAIEPKPKAIEPKPQAIEPKPQAIEPKPQAIEPKPQAVEPKPQAIEPKPKAIEPKPKAVEPKPQAIEPKPKAVEPKPQAIEPKPKAVEPAPASTPFVSASTSFTKENQNTRQTAQTKPEAAPSFPNIQGTLPGFENLGQPTTDSQLTEALLPIVESSLEKALYAPKTGLHMYLEPMLRATVRRAIAEQMQTIHHFGQINAIDRITWRFKALFTSRTYDDIVFDRTRRYRVEEVYLLRYDSNELVSYASHDPSRHATPRKIKYDLSRLVEELKDEDGELRKSFELPNHNNAVVRCGQDCFLLASVRGPINALVRADLDYVLSQIEQRFGDRLRDKGEQFIHVLQPILEGCLLIQSPPPPH